MSRRRGRYTAVGIIFHWTMAALVFGQLGLGWWMGRLDAGYGKMEAYGVHAGIGMMILLLAFLRLGWRIVVPRPLSTEDIPGWQHLAARATHLGFYALMVALPLTGLVMLSALARQDAVRMFGTRPLPVFPWVTQLPVLAHTQGEARAELAHDVLVWTMIALIVAHVGAALQHHFLNRDKVLHRMAPAIDPLGDTDIQDLTEAR